jgi:hypothetical protein
MYLPLDFRRRAKAMEPPQANPSWKRWRRLVVAFVLVLMSTVLWWYWPRGDARFVGKWALFRDRESSPFSIVTLRANGTGKSDSTNRTPFASFFWSGDKRYLTLACRTPLADWIHPIGLWLHSKRLRAFRVDGRPEPVTWITENEFSTEEANTLPPKTIYRRLPQ